MSHSGRFKSFCIAFVLVAFVGSSLIVRAQAPSVPADQFQAQVPVMTFLDMHTGQPWGRYVVAETVTVPKYEYREVKERVWVPTWVQEPRNTTVTQYDPIVSYQLKPRSIPSMNPFSPPQQILEYAPIVQYQPRNVNMSEMVNFQKYEEREISRMVPELVNASEQRSRFVDRPLTANPADGPMASNLIQESAMVAQATRTSARYPTRSIDYPQTSGYGSPLYASNPSSVAWNTPRTLVPPTLPVGSQGVVATPAGYTYAAQSNTNAPSMSLASANNVPNSITVGNGVTYSSTMVPVPGPQTPVQPNPYVASAQPPVYPVASQPMPQMMPQMPMANPYPVPGQVPNYASAPFPPQAVAPGYSVPAGYANPYAYQPNPYVNPYANPYGVPMTAPAAASSPYSWFTTSGTLFPTNMFSTRSASTMSTPGAPAVSSTTAYASNAPYPMKSAQPTSVPTAASSGPSTVTTTVTSTGPAPYGTPYPYRDPMQAGLPPTVMR